MSRHKNNVMKKNILNLLMVIALLSYNSAKSQCGCVSMPTSSFSLIINGNLQTITGNSLTICQPIPFYGFIAAAGAVHPNQTINTWPWTSNIIFQCNSGFDINHYLSLPYTYGMLGNNMQFNLGILNPGANTISIAATCSSSATTCPIKTLTVNMVAMTANITTMRTECCQGQLTQRPNGQTQVVVGGRRKIEG